MSRDGSQSRIDSIRSSVNTTNPLERTALNNAVRYNAMLQLFDDTTDNTQGRAQVRNALGGRDPRTIDDDLLARSLEDSIQDLTREFNEEVGSDEDIIKTPQTEMTNRMFRTDLGRIVGNEITFNRGRFFEANQKHNLLSHGSAGYAFSSYLSSFQDNDDAFGSRVVYDNVFGAFESGEKSLSQRAAEIDPEDYAATSSQKVLQTLVNKNILDSRHSLNKVDREFQRFFGQSAVAAASQSGTGLVRARQILETSIERSLELQQYYLNTEQYLKDNPQNALFQKRLTDLQNQISDERLTQQAYLDEIKEGYSVRRNNESAPGTRIINKAGVREFVDLFNSADSEITIQTYQLQNQTIGSSIRDVMRRRVIEKAITGDTKGFKLNLVLAYPKQRINNGGNTEDDRYNIGGTGYAINGPNLIEALTMKQFEEDLVEELVQIGYAKADAEKLINVNLEFRDRKFHPKLYMTDTMAAIGTQNLTAPVGNSINQAGSNFEQMYIARNYMMSDDELMASRTQGALRSEKSLQGKITSSLLYRQIRQASEFERDFIARQANSGRVLPTMNIGGKSLGSNYNVGFAGDIYKHLTDTLDYAYQNSIGVVHHTTSSSGGRAMPGSGDRSLNMFMILDGSFMLQLGDIAFQEKALLGEMGDEVTKTFRAKDARVAKYRQYQNKLFDLLITNNANVVVDKKNYQEQVYDPIADKIEKAGSEKLKRNFAKAGKNLGLMAGNAIYGSDIEGMDIFLQSQGFTDDAGFSASDRKQIMGMGSGNIRMAKVPRQHAKSFGLVDYTDGAPDLISYYQGSSNMGFYSLDAADKTNAEMGVMFGKGTGLSRVKDQVYISSYAGDADIEAVREATQNAIDTANQFRDFALTEDEEINELRNIQDRFYQTYNQLSNNTIQNRYIDNVSNAPMWQSNVNSGALQVQKARLEDLRTTLGLTDTAFKIQERLGEDGGVKSLNITINMASILGSDDFTNSTTPGKKLTFEISVLNSPKDRRIINQNSSTDPRNGSSDVPGMVYFVDKNKLIGNGIFVNDGGQSVDVLGRKGFNDKFQYGLDAGTTTVKSGEFAHMSSIDMTTNIFGQLLGDAMVQQTIEEPARRYDRIVKRGLENELLTDYLAVLLRGRSSHTSKDGKEMTALDIISNMKAIELEELGGMILTKTKSQFGSVAQIRNLTPTAFKQLKAGDKERANLDFINSFRYALADKDKNLFGNNNNISFEQRTNVLEDTTKPFLSNEGLAKAFLEEYLLPHFQKVVQTSPELKAEILKYADSNNYADIEKSNISAKQAMIFEPFLQSVEDTTYGGQQGYYRTLMYGLSGMNPAVDSNTAEIMDDYDDKPGLHQARRFARLTALSYTPTTDIHEFLYRSIASGASSTGKTDQSLNSSLLKQQGRQVGNAQNFDVLQSVGIGTKIDRSTYVEGFGDELKITGEFLQSLKDQGLDDSQIKIIQDRLKEDYKNQSREFMAISTTDRNGQLQTRATNNMLFFTGNAGKISQLPQRIKNALGARPFYQYGIKAQRAMTQTAFEDGGSLKDITANYVNKQGQAVDELLEYQIQKQNDILKTTRLDSDANDKASNKLQLINQFKQDLSLKKVRSNTGQTVGYEAGQLFKMGAVYTGRIKSVLSADQALYVARIREDIETIFNDADIDTYGLSDEERDRLLAQQKETKEELIRSYVLRASLDNSGLGKMIAGNDRTKYNIALLQMSGTYTDTFVANPLLGNVYNNRKAYNTLKRSGANLESLDLTKEVLIDGVKQKLSDYVVVSGQREGYLVTQQISTKGSMMAEQEDLRATDTEVKGERMLFREGDVVAEDDQGRFVHKRDGKVIRTAGNKRTFSTLRGEVDNTNFGVSSSLATKSTAVYGRRGEHSVDYIFASMERDGNFANNEYLQELIRLRSIVAGGGRRVEGTDSSALVKGVANFAGQGVYRHKDKFVSMNTFQYLETQIEDKFDEGQIGGSLAAMLRAENRNYVFNNEGYHTPLSSMISGVYNANNFKSFVWSHGATILKETKGTGKVENNFMLNELLGIGQNLTDADRLKLAQKAASGLLISFGSSYLKGGDSAEFQESVIRGLKQGAAGRNYQKLVGAMTIVNKGQMTDGKLFEKIVSKTKESQGIYFSDANLAGLRGLDANDISKIMSGDAGDPETIKATKRFMSQVEGMLVSQAQDISSKGYMQMSSFSNRQAALIVTAIDIMHQISANETAYRLPHDIDKGSEKIKQVMTSILGGEDFMTASNQKVFGTDRQGLMDEAFEMIQGINENVNMVALYADIAYSQSKDATGTETVGRHEAQHLMMPFLGDIQAFSKEGQLSNMQHTFASLMALSQGTNSIMAYNALNKSGFSNAKAWNMSTVNDEQRLLMSSFTQQDFLGFYRSTATDQQKNTLLKREFKNINKIIASGKYHNLDPHTTFDTSTPEGKQQQAVYAKRMASLNKDVEDYVTRFYSLNGGTLDNRVKQQKIAEINAKIFGADGSIIKEGVTEFLMNRQELVVMELDKLNNVYNANQNKALGSDATSNFIDTMQNKEMFFSLPELRFETQDGMAKVTTKGSINTFLPAAKMMKKLGVQHADFIDPLIGVYKDLAEVFVPGSIAHNALTKVYASQQQGQTAILTAIESEALQRVMNAATRMPIEAQKAIEGARAQEAFASKVKYKGFTSTGIGSFLVPFDAVALASSKLAEAGFELNDRKTKALQQTLERRNNLITNKKAYSDFGSSHRDPGARDDSLYKDIQAADKLDRDFHKFMEKTTYESEQALETKVYQEETIVQVTGKTKEGRDKISVIASMGADELELQRQKRRERKARANNRKNTVNSPQEDGTVKLHRITPISSGKVQNVIYIDRVAEVGVFGIDGSPQRRDLQNEIFANERTYQEFDDSIKSEVNWGELDDLVFSRRVTDERSSSIEDGRSTNWQKYEQKLDSNLEDRYKDAQSYFAKQDYVDDYYTSLIGRSNLTADESTFVSQYIKYKSSADYYQKKSDYYANDRQFIKSFLTASKEDRRSVVRYNYVQAFKVSDLELQENLKRDLELITEEISSKQDSLKKYKASIKNYKKQKEFIISQIGDTSGLYEEKSSLKDELSILNQDVNRFKYPHLKDRINEIHQDLQTIRSVLDTMEEPYREKLQKVNTALESLRGYKESIENEIVTYEQKFANVRKLILTTDEERAERIKKRTGKKANIQGKNVLAELHRQAYAIQTYGGSNIAGLLPGSNPTMKALPPSSSNYASEQPSSDRVFITGNNVRFNLNSVRQEVTERKLVQYEDELITEDRRFIVGTDGSSTVRYGSPDNSYAIVLASDPFFEGPENEYERVKVEKLKRDMARIERAQKAKELRKAKGENKVPKYQNYELYESNDVTKKYIEGLIPGKSLEYSKSLEGMKNRVKVYYDLQMTAVVQGVSKDIMESYKEMVATSRLLKGTVDTLFEDIGLSKTTLQSSQEEILKLYSFRDKVKGRLKDNMQTHDRFAYETVSMNLDAMINDLEIKSRSTRTKMDSGEFDLKRLNSDQVAARETKKEIYQNVTSVLNIVDESGEKAFSHLGADTTGMKAYELFDERYAPSGGLTLDEVSRTSSIVKAIQGLQKDVTDKTVRTKTQKELALGYLNNLKTQQEKHLADFRNFTNVRDDGTLDAEKERAAYAEMLKSHENILNSIESARLDVVSGVMEEEGGVDRIFTSLNTSMIINDKINLQFAEVFRSPPPGSTDPRLHSYRIMNGVTALNRIANMTGAGGMSETRNQTSTYITAVGMVTYGGGDFDGDPYTTIVHNREKTARAIMNKRLDIQRDEATLRAFAQTPLSQNATPKQIAERQAKEAQLQANVIKRKDELAIEEKRFDKQLKVGYQEFDARARRQAAEYYGIDERILVKGKDLHNKIDAEEYIDPDSGETIRGLGTKTYNADTVFTLMNTGHGLVEGLDQKGKDLMTLYDTFDQAFGIRKDSFEALKKMRAVAQSFNNLRDAKTGMIKESAQGEVLKLFRESMGTTVNLANADDTGIIATVLRNNDSETAKVMLESISDIQDQEISFRRERGFSQDILDASDQNKARSQEFVHHFIGGALMAQMQAHDTYTGFMKKGAGMQINEGGMDMLLKTLGKAGGEVLGKTYNTIIGTTFKDSPLISFATSVLDPKERGEGSLYDVITQEFIAKANDNEEMGKQSASDYFGSLKHALDKARGTQGFMKNIHQLLRDSIKLKSDKDMISELEKASVDYSTIAEKLRKHDLANKGTEGYLKERNALLLERDAAINRLSSGLGDGPGLKALVDLDFLINQSKKADPNEKPGLTVGQFSFMFLEGGDIKSAEFNTMVDRYDQEIEEQLKLIEGDTSREGDLKRSKLLESRLSEEERARLSSLKPTDSGSETGLLKVAQYRVANQLTNLVSGYRMSTSLTLKAGELESQAQSYLTLKQEEAYHSGRGLLGKNVVQQEVLDDYKIPDNPLDVKSEAGKARKLRKIEALSQYLGVDNSSFYQGNAAQAQIDLDEKLDAAAKKAGLSRESYLLTFDQRYENSRDQARAMIGSSGEGLTTFTNLEGIRSDMSNMFKSGDQGRDDKMDKLLGIMDAEALQMASQLIGSDKLMTGGFDAFSKLFEGILSNVMVDELDKVQADLIEVAKKESPGVTEEALLKNPAFQKQVSDAKEKVVRKKSIQLTLGGGPGDRSTSEEGATIRSVTTELMESEAVQKAYTQSIEGSLASQQAEAVQKLADHMILKGSESEDQFNKLLDAIGTRAGSPDELSAEQQRQNLRSRLKEQQKIKFNKAVRQQMADRQKMADDNPYLKRGSMLSKLSDTMIGSMATNKGSTTLDLLAPIAITAIGAAVAEGDVNAETMQELAGATVTSLMYARTGFIDGNAKTYAKRMAGAQAISSVFKFRSALNRYEGQSYAEGEKIAMAARDTVVRESISMVVNKALAPALTRNIASKLGNNTSIASDLLTGKKHQAVQQISGNIGASLISAATSTMISGLILKTTVPNPEKKMYADLQQFEVNVATVNSVNQQIAASRAQQAAAEDVEVQESGGEPEVSAYNVVTSSTYGADSRADSFALEDFEELELGNDGSLAFNFG